MNVKYTCHQEDLKWPSKLIGHCKRARGNIAYECISRSSNIKALKIVCGLELLILSWYNTAISFKDPKFVHSKSFEMNQPQTYRGSSFYVGWLREYARIHAMNLSSLARVSSYILIQDDKFSQISRVVPNQKGTSMTRPFGLLLQPPVCGCWKCWVWKYWPTPSTAPRILTGFKTLYFTNMSWKPFQSQLTIKGSGGTLTSRLRPPRRRIHLCGQGLFHYFRYNIAQFSTVCLCDLGTYTAHDTTRLPGTN